ncbi:MAG: thioredoxin family protein [Gemmataceae bacterium]|nr:thioredoxin family protein [Gemmataceae bacterium]
MTTSRQSIIKRLKDGKDVEEWADLCIYPSGSLFVVELVPPAGPLDTAGLSEEHAAALREEGELAEYCETPEEAADLYLALEAKYRDKLAAVKDVMRDPPEGAPRKPRVLPAKKASPVQLPSLDEAAFEDEIGGSTAPVAVLFWSPWSAADRLLLPVVGKVASGFPSVRFMTMDAEDSPTVVERLRIASTPCLLLFRDGSIHSRLQAPLTEDGLRQALSSLPK